MSRPTIQFVAFLLSFSIVLAGLPAVTLASQSCCCTGGGGSVVAIEAESARELAVSPPSCCQAQARPACPAEGAMPERPAAEDDGPAAPLERDQCPCDGSRCPCHSQPLPPAIIGIGVTIVGTASHASRVEGPARALPTRPAHGVFHPPKR